MNSSPNTTIRTAILLASPLLYGAICVSVFVAFVGAATSSAVVRLLEALPGGSYLFESTPLSVALFLFGCTLVLAVLDLAIYGLERLQRFGIKAHARHCALLYAGTVFVIVSLLAIPGLQAGMVQYDLGLAACAVAAYAVLVDAGVVISMRHLTRARSGGAP